MPTTMKRGEEAKRNSMKDRNVTGNKNLGGVTRSGSQTSKVKSTITRNIKGPIKNNI